MKSIKIIKPDNLLKGTIQLPSSKSISNRLLIMQALSAEEFKIGNLSKAEDTLLLQKLLNKISSSAGQQDAVELDCSDAGTDLRFLTALLSVKPGRWVLTGTNRMRQRPVGELVENLKQLGAAIEYLGNVGFPPLLIKGRNLKSMELHVNAGVSSQFVSALLLIGPYLSEGLTLHLKGDVVSEPYIDMTVKLMKTFGIKARKWKHMIQLEPGAYTGKKITVESDWSSASFWYQAAALADKADLLLPGFDEKSLQGDSIIASAFTVFGVKSDFLKTRSKKAAPNESATTNSPSHHLIVSPFTLHLSRHPSRLEGFYYDFTHHPDLALPVITTCAALGLRGRFEGLKTLVIKESDRVRSLTTELQKLGCKLTLTSGDYPVIEIQPSKLIAKPDVIIDTYRDHRMAMTFAMLALKTGSLRIADPDVVAKSYPGFWGDLESVGFQIK
ncbi:MAG: 3-phosphoshikimate 1-carboxyvinyltransferase [Bacteroidetes bacterium]|nr:3-phosphoshikimate 1-carboxyvinyltransferase [Bacteroidota bacterium]